MSEEFLPADASKATTTIFLAITCNHLHRRLGNSVGILYARLFRFRSKRTVSIPSKNVCSESFAKDVTFCCCCCCCRNRFLSPLVLNNTRNNSVLSVCAGEDKSAAVSSLIKIDFYYGSHLLQSRVSEFLISW